MRKLGRLIPLYLWYMRYIRKRFGRFIPMRLVKYGSEGKSKDSVQR